jgi:hypothetical protein
VSEEYEIRCLKIHSYVRFIEEIKDPAASRLKKVLSKGHTNGLISLLKADAETEDPMQMISSRSNAWRRSKKLFDGKKVTWAINQFKAYKSPGPDQIVPDMLQKGIEILLPTLLLVFRASYALGYS